jgi:hypothetical protein
MCRIAFGPLSGLGFSTMSLVYQEFLFKRLGFFERNFIETLHRESVKLDQYSNIAILPADRDY